MATSPLQYRRAARLESGGQNQLCSPTLQSEGQNQQWPTCGQIQFSSSLPSRGLPTLQSRGQNQQWPACGQMGFITLALRGVPNASQRGGGGISSGLHVGRFTSSPLPCAVWGVPNRSKRGTKSAGAHMRADWLHHPLSSRGSPTPHRTGGDGMGWECVQHLPDTSQSQ